MYRQLPGQDFSTADMPLDIAARHELMVDLFGQYLFWMRDWAVSDSQEIIESPQKRETLGNLRRKSFDDIAALPPEQLEQVVKIAETTVDRFCNLLLSLLGNEGNGLKIGSGEAVRFRLNVELINTNSGQIVNDEIINRGGRFFPDYWGRWLNRYSDK